MNTPRDNFTSNSAELLKRKSGAMSSFSVIDTGNEEVVRENYIKDKMDENNSVNFFGRHFNRFVMVTHINIFLYSCGFWIQLAVFPVSFYLFYNHSYGSLLRYMHCL